MATTGRASHHYVVPRAQLRDTPADLTYYAGALVASYRGKGALALSGDD